MMHPDMEALIGVQACDGEIARLRAEIAALPARQSIIEKALEAAEAALRRAGVELKNEESMRRQQQSDVKDQQIKITKYRGQIETVQNDAQYKALQHEIEFAQQKIAGLEDAELASMERTEGFEAAKATATEEVASQTRLLAREKEHGAAVRTIDEAKLLLLGKERDRLRALVGENALSNYDRVAKAKKTGVASAWDQKCSACQMMVRPQRWNDLRNADNNDVITCETCGRRLYYDVGHGTGAAKEAVALQALNGLQAPEKLA